LLEYTILSQDCHKACCEVTKLIMTLEF